MNGGGSVRLRPDGRWEGRYYGTDRRRRRSVFGKTRREAQEKLRAALVQADAGVKPVGQRLTVAEWLSEWLETSVRPNRRPRTTESYAETARRYIVPSIGRIPVAKLEPEDVARMLASLAAKQPAISPTTQRYAYVVLRIALGRALKSGRVIRNVATLIDPPFQRALAAAGLRHQRFHDLRRAYATLMIEDGEELAVGVSDLGALFTPT